jgi:hypothetical protein
MVSFGREPTGNRPSHDEGSALSEAERAIDRALAPKKLRLVPPERCD